jgi:hypothetical protein
VRISLLAGVRLVLLVSIRVPGKEQKSFKEYMVEMCSRRGAGVLAVAK